MKKILIVEDEEAIREGLAATLTYHRYKVETAATGSAAEKAVEKERPDLVILDLMLPHKDGFTLAAEWRKLGYTFPILMLTARGEEENKVKGLELGADDYLTKPFSLKELVARVAALLRRRRGDGNLTGELDFAGGTVNFDRMEYVGPTGADALTALDLKMIRLLANNPGRNLTREELLERVWDMDHEELWTRTVDMQVAKLRKKIKDVGGRDEAIETVRGSGYRYHE